MQSEPNKRHEEGGCSYVSDGAVAKTSANTVRNCPTKPENAELRMISDVPENLVRK
jgi:hypothetical protein